MTEDIGGTCSCGGSCGCGGGGHSHQTQEVYLTRDQYIARLEQYLIDLKAEIKSVEAELAEIRQSA